MKGVRRPDVDRQQVGLAGLEIAAKQGLKKVTLRNVAEKVGMEAMSLYHDDRISDKDDLITAVLERIVEPHIAKALTDAELALPDVIHATRELLIADAVSGDRLVPEELLRMLAIPFELPEEEEVSQ